MIDAETIQSYADEYRSKKIAEQSQSTENLMPYPNQDRQFLQFLFDFKKQVTTPLRYAWKGYEQNDVGQWVLKHFYWEYVYNGEKEVWQKERKGYQLMNNRGITWSISIIESYINPVYVVSNYDDNSMNWTIREVGAVVYNTLCSRYREFEMHRLDIQRVANEIISKIHAVLLGAKSNGFRLFFQTTHHTSEVKTAQQMVPMQSSGIIPGVANLFNRNKPPQLW